MRQIVQYLERQTKLRLVMQALVLVLLLGGIDFLTGSEFSFSVFYTLPIAIAAWFAGREAGILTSFTAAICWLGADLLAAMSIATDHPLLERGGASLLPCGTMTPIPWCRAALIDCPWLPRVALTTPRGSCRTWPGAQNRPDRRAI